VLVLGRFDGPCLHIHPARLSPAHFRVSCMVWLCLFPAHCLISDEFIRRTHPWTSSYSCVAPGARAASSPAFVYVVVEGHTYAGHASEVRILLIYASSAAPIVIMLSFPSRVHSIRSGAAPQTILTLWDLPRIAHGRAACVANPLYSVCEDGCGSCACHTGSVGPDPSLCGTRGLHRAVRGCLVYGVRVAAETPTQPLFSWATSAQRDTLHAVTHARLCTCMRCVSPVNRGCRRRAAMILPSMAPSRSHPDVSVSYPRGHRDPHPILPAGASSKLRSEERAVW
jgi:hypothetical protein